ERGGSGAGWARELAGALSDAEKARQLRNNDMYGNTRQEASYHWCRQQVRDPAELEDPSGEQHHADEQGECCGGRSDRGGASGGESSQRSCEYRRYGRVSAGRQYATCA